MWHLFKPHIPYSNEEEGLRAGMMDKRPLKDRGLLLRCGCGDLFWERGGELEKHIGHGHIRAAQGGSTLEWLKLKLGRIK